MKTLFNFHAWKMVYKIVGDGRPFISTTNKLRPSAQSLIGEVFKSIEIFLPKMSASRIEILRDCCFYLEKFGLCNERHVRILHLPIPFALVNLLCVLSQTIAIYLLIRTVYVANFDLNVISSAFAITIGLIQIELIYFTLAANRSTTLKIVRKMQGVVDYRKT